ncbi:MAG: hypothetical protein WC222_09185 [Parachlamydiales bacterium]|jgi:hypothetical protein
MLRFARYLLTAACVFMGGLAPLQSANQTPDVSPITPQYFVPFFLDVEQLDFSLPSGIQSFVRASYKGKWLLLAGRVNGLHNFNNDNNNFPPSLQNTTVYVVDVETGAVFSKSLNDPSSGLTQEQVDILSVTSAQFYQHKKTLYMTGGYGVNTATGLFDTKPVLTAIDIPGMIQWVTTTGQGKSAVQNIRQLRDPVFQVTGGYMSRSLKGLTLLIFGQNYFTFYTPGQNGIYSEQVRRFKIKDDGETLSVKVLSPSPQQGPNAFYRRRDLNVVPIMQSQLGLPLPAYLALSGVFTESGGIWTVPVYITTKGWPSMYNPSNPGTFKQGMNNYNCPVLGTFSEKTGNMFISLFGGLSYGYFNNGAFTTDDEIPFINQITTIQFDKRGNINQFLMDAEYPVVISAGSNPGNQLLFGAGANFIPADGLEKYKNGVIDLDKIKYPTVVGYIVGGIASTLPNTTSSTDSTASPLIFKVTLKPTASQD